MRRTSDKKPTPPPPFPGACALQQAGGGAPAGRRARWGRSWRAGCCWRRGSAVGTPCGLPRSAFQPAGPPPLRDPWRAAGSPRTAVGAHLTQEKSTTSASRPWNPSTVANATASAAASPPRCGGTEERQAMPAVSVPSTGENVPGVRSSAGWRAGREMDRRARRAGRHGLQPAAPTCWKVRRSSASCARYGVSTATSPRSALWRAARPAVEVRMRSRGASEFEPPRQQGPPSVGCAASADPARGAGAVACPRGLPCWLEAHPHTAPRPPPPPLHC